MCSYLVGFAHTQKIACDVYIPWCVPVMFADLDFVHCHVRLEGNPIYEQWACVKLGNPHKLQNVPFCPTNLV